MKAKQFLFCLLTLLFTVSVPRAVADEDQPRFMIPSADFSDPDKDSERGYAAITTDNPFFTIYMWMFNDYKDDTYWAVKPTLKIDGNELELKGFTDGTYDWTCTVNGVVKYYVHSHANSILVDDSKLFQQQFPEASKKSHGGRDRYMGLDIYIYDNQPGQKHTITARGKVHTDWGAFGEDAWMDVLTLDGKTELSSGETYFNLTDLAATLEWTAPHTLTFTSPSLKDRSWGKYQVVMDNKASSNQQSSGVISVSHDYGSDADYLRDSNIPIEYRYTGKYNNHEMIFHQTKQEKPTTLPYVKSLMASAFDTWKKTVTLKWQMENITTKNNDGTVYLRRGNEVIYSESLSATGQYTDNISYDTPYDYSLTFVPTGWPSETIERQLTYHTVVSLERDFSITDLKVGVSGQGYRVSWTGSSYRSSEKSYYRVYRKVVTASDEAITFADTDLLTSIEATTNTSYSYQDNDVNTTDTYAYMVTVHAQEKDYQTAPVQPSDRLDGSKITSFDATRGTYTNRVELKWTADVKGNDHMVYVIKRHTIDDSGNEQYAANNAYVVLDTLKDDATTRHTTYTDTKMLCGYYYMYKIEGLVNGSKTSFTSQLSDGFARSTATVTGNVTYSSAGRTIGVEGVRMNFEAEGSELQQRSLRCSADSSGLVWQQDNVVLSNYFNQHPFSLQMYVRPDGEQGSNPCLMEMRGILRLGLCDKTADGYLVAATVGDKTYKSTHRLHPEMFNHLTFAYDGKSCAQLMIVDSTNVVMTDTLFTGITLYWQPTPGYEGRVTVFTDADKRNTVRGYVDEVRFFKRQLSVADVQQNFDRLMGGSEVGLIAYWPLDESISTIFRAYDYSSTDGKANENHALIPGGTRTSAIVPGDQLSLHAITDTLGYYALQGLSFAGDGTTYHITPTKGTHDFEPDSRNIYVSQESLSFQPQNFTDNSSFNVKGKVYYENTLYPVKGCTFKVDGVQVKDKYGQLIATDENGEYTIPVSIGLHVIQIEKEGHVFLNDGLWPASGYANINDSISGLTFTDVTKAIVAGRIVGGSVEQGKPLALGQSKANVGAATLTLLTSADVKDAKKMNVLYDTEEGIYNDNPNTLELTAANPDLVHCTASVGGATGLEADANVKTITIHTSPETGEFAVLLPPVPYYVTTIVDHNDEATTALNKYGAQLLDASNVLRTDTATCDVLLPDSTTQHLRFVYNVAFQPSYNAVPIISVRQTDNEFGAFGDSTVVAEEYKDTVRAYHIDTNTNSLVYDYGYPIFTKATTYEFEIASFERYLNYDADPLHPVAYDQPSSAGFLSIRNPMALVGDTIDKVLLDDDGKYIYKFQALEPNVVEPFTQAISICLSIGDNVTPWYWNYSDSEQSLQGYVFSAKLTGSAFFTKAPDELINILRDPFGSSSSMSWSSGSTIHFSHTRDITYNAAVASGRDVATTVGGKAATGAPGLYAFQGFTIDGDRTRGFAWSISLNHDKTVSHSFTTSKDYSTSSGKIFDGPSGDVFIGISSSLTYGDGREVRLLKGPDKDYYVGTQDVLVTGDSITGMFVYSQYQIENVMIPLLKDKRRSRLTVVNPSALADYRTNFTNPTDSVIYMTSLSPDDPRFGSHNADSQVWGNDTLLTWRTDSMCYWGNSYTVFLPKSYKSSEEEWDCIAEITSQIENWQNKLRDNEQAKVNALTARRKYYKDSYAFDAGSGAVTYSKTTSRTRDYSGSFKYNLARYRKYKLTSTTETASNGSKRSGAFEWKIDTDRNHKIAGGRSNSNTYTMTLLDEVRDNYHSVERYDAPDDFSWIYKQTGGVSSQNYEPEVLTKYYQPGTKISEATVQLEVPHIYCAETVKTNVSADDGADFYLELCNATQAKVTGYINFALQVANDKWATKANVTMNGQPVPDNIFGVYLAPYDTAHVRLNVKPADKSVIHIDSLLVSFYSDGQWTISDDIYLTAHFQPQAEKIKLMASRTVVNTATDTTLVLTASDFNINSSILNAVRLQQRKAGTPDWTTLHSWVKGTPHGDTESALTTPIDTLIDMHNSIAYPDGTYEFRAVTDCTVVGEQILGESPLVTVIKDVTLPQPMALPEPTDGVLGVGDEISVTFNEDIYSQSLSKDANFIIQSVLNTDSIAHEVALRLDGTATPAATSQTGLALGNSSFTVCTWLKYSGTAGTILRHGDGRNAFRINLEEDGHLTVYVTDKNGNAQPYTSINTIPQDLWVYLGLSYDVDAGTLTAHYASGDNEEVLMTGVNVGTSATSQGKIYLGENLTGAMHELSIYSTALTWTTIQSQMYTGKSNTTPSLIGYWHLDEGHGTKSEDLARSRHIQIASPNA